MVRQWQQLFFDKRYASTEMTNLILSLLQRATILSKKKVIKREDLDAVAEMMGKRFLFTRSYGRERK
jgi:acetolactate synthase-1/2/3 large subunit